ncbi:transcription factor kayak [Cyclospora cayetanensis]|uniref:Transcription factor kayak n=1 Tax=Cyclospora cayetanensis TaxID=88456 RepID=A0A6P6S1F1_9EIME|nr:transcription factor kayak [Cyclospora cayetanensis]
MPHRQQSLGGLASYLQGPQGLTQQFHRDGQQRLSVKDQQLQLIHRLQHLYHDQQLHQQQQQLQQQQLQQQQQQQCDCFSPCFFFGFVASVLEDRQMLQQWRQLRNKPTSGFPNFKARGNSRKLEGQAPSAELQRLLFQRVKAFTKPDALPVDPPVNLEASRVPSAHQMASAILPHHLLPQQQEQQPQRQEEDQQKEDPILDRIALHLGALSQLQACGKVVGIGRSLRVLGEGSAFTGASAVFSAGGPWLEAFLQLQMERLQHQRQPEDAAATVASAFLSVAKQLHAELLPPHLQQRCPLSALSASAVSTPEAAAAAARAVAHALNATCKAPAATSAYAAAEMHAAERPSTPPEALLRPGALVVTPGFGANSLFLLHCVEPTAALTQQQQLQQLLQLIDCDVQWAKEQQPQKDAWEEARRQRAPRLHMLERCYTKAFDAAASLGLQTLVTPLLGTGHGGFSTHAAAYCAAAAAHRWQVRQQQQQQQQGLKIVFCTTEQHEWRALDANIRRRIQLFNKSAS